MTKDQLRQHILMLAMQLTQLEKENKKLKERIKELELCNLKLQKHIWNKEEKSQISNLVKDKEHWRDLYWAECEKNKKLKEENKSLKEYQYRSQKQDWEVIERLHDKIDELEDSVKWYEKEEERLVNECRKLRAENDTLKNNAMEDMKVQTELEEKIRFLEDCLDNKEKVNQSLREEIGKMVMKE